MRVFANPVVAWYARWVVRLRWLVVAAWLVVTAAAVWYLPGFGQSGSDLSQLVSSDNPAVQSEVRSFDKFGFPLLSRVAIVQRDPKGLSPAVQARAVRRAQDVSQGAYPEVKPIMAAIPVMNTLQLLPGSKEDGTTIVTMLFTAPDVPFADQVAAAQQLVANHYQPDDAVVGVTGSVPARVEQGRIVLSSLPTLEVITVAAIFIIVAVAFRSLIAPLLALAVAGVAILITLHVGGSLAIRFGVPVPQETQPLLVALLLGVVTDYVVFYMSGVRAELASGAGRLAVAERATARFTTIIVTAGATAAAGTGAMIVAKSPVFRAFGPGMALAVLIGMVVAVTLVPALLAILGPVAFRSRRQPSAVSSSALWSSRPSSALWSRRRSAARSSAVSSQHASRADGSSAVPSRRGSAADVSSPPSSAAPAEPDPVPSSGGHWARLLTRPWFAPVVALVCLAGLGAAAVPLRDIALGVSFVEALPSGHPARQAGAAAQTGFADGILSPTELLIQGANVASHQAELTRLEQSLSHVSGVAAVVGGTARRPRIGLQHLRRRPGLEGGKEEAAARRARGHAAAVRARHPRRRGHPGGQLRAARHRPAAPVPGTGVRADRRHPDRRVRGPFDPRPGPARHPRIRERLARPEVVRPVTAAARRARAAVTKRRRRRCGALLVPSCAGRRAACVAVR